MAQNGEDEFFSERVVLPNGHEAFVFINEAALEWFVNSTTILCDHTYRSCTRLFYQIGSLHCVSQGVVS
jgi:hypothetical protein